MENNDLRQAIDGIFGEGVYDEVVMEMMFEDMKNAYLQDISDNTDCCKCDCCECEDEEPMTFYDLHLRLQELDGIINDICSDLYGNDILTDISRDILNNMLILLTDEAEELVEIMKSIRV